MIGEANRVGVRHGRYFETLLRRELLRSAEVRKKEHHRDDQVVDHRGEVQVCIHAVTAVTANLLLHESQRDVVHQPLRRRVDRRAVPRPERRADHVLHLVVPVLFRMLVVRVGHRLCLALTGTGW